MSNQEDQSIEDDHDQGCGCDCEGCFMAWGAEVRIAQAVEGDQRRRHLGLTPTAMAVRTYIEHIQDCDACQRGYEMCRWGRDLRRVLNKEGK